MVEFHLWGKPPLFLWGKTIRQLQGPTLVFKGVENLFDRNLHETGLERGVERLCVWMFWFFVGFLLTFPKRGGPVNTSFALHSGAPTPLTHTTHPQEIDTQRPHLSPLFTLRTPFSSPNKSGGSGPFWVVFSNWSLLALTDPLDLRLSGPY